MNWSDIGFLLSKNKYNENSIIAEVFTEKYGKVSGIIFGASSKKIKNYLQIGNKLHVNYNFKNENKLGYFKIEIIEAITPLYFDNRKKLLCITSAISIVKLLTADLQSNPKIFFLIESFFLFKKNNNWIKEYIFWELEFLKTVGYDLEIKNIVEKQIINNEISYFVKSSTEKKIVPNFLINSDLEDVDNSSLLKGLKLVGDYLEKSILKPNNINYPKSRFDFISIIK